MSDEILLKHSQFVNSKLSMSRASRVSLDSFDTMLDLSTKNIVICLPHNYIIAGERLTGSVFITIETNCEDVKVELNLTGLEELRIYNNFQLISRQKSKVFSFSEIIKKCDLLEPNCFKIPFGLDIPKNAPASFSYSDETSTNWYIKGSISYLISCRFYSSAWEHSSFQQIFLRSSNSKENCFEELEQKEEISSCMCWPSGFTVFYLQGVEKDNCQVNGRLVYKLLTNNSNCSKSIVRVCSQIIRVILFKGEKENVKLKHVINKIYRHVIVPKKSGVCDSPDFLFIHDLRMGYEDYNTSTTEGETISCKFYLEVLVFFKGTFNDVPVTILTELFVNPRERILEQVNYPEVFIEDEMVILSH